MTGRFLGWRVVWLFFRSQFFRAAGILAARRLEKENFARCLPHRRIRWRRMLRLVRDRSSSGKSYLLSVSVSRSGIFFATFLPGDFLW